MRTLTKFASTSTSVQSFLNKLANANTTREEYTAAFYHLGETISSIINENYKLENKQVTLACSSEDADWLSKGILDNIKTLKLSLAVFWNLRTNVFDQENLSIAPITKSYIEPIQKTDVLIICKSIIYTSCVVRTNLTYLIDKINPSKILITAPVIFSNAESSLKKEFSDEIGSKFEFIYFATDNEVNAKGEVIPGIGGSVYQRLGLENSEKKNKYIPQIVKIRREQLSA